MSVFVRILISDIKIVSGIYFISELKIKHSFPLKKMYQFNVAILPSPSFRSFVPHSLHSGASGSHTRVNASFHFTHPALGQTSLHSILPLHLSLPSHHQNSGERFIAFFKNLLFFPIRHKKVLLSPSNYLNQAFPPGVTVWVSKVIPCFEGEQVQACGFAENLHPPFLG